MNAIQIILLVIQFLISVSFILIVMSQTTKNEGLGGPIGGNISPNFKGKPGREEQIQKLTLYLGAAWFAFGIITGIAFRNYG
jgi:protein translocase SecG subunit